MAPSTSPLRWDIFCTVIDNYGDIGVAWRLARQLCREHGQKIRLWVDDLASFARLCPGLDCTADSQTLDGIVIRHWQPEAALPAEPGDVVLDAFGCTLPDPFIAAMAARPEPPCWINLEYLSAEEWVECCHGMCSPHPRHNIARHFFFPGFSARTGGVIAERGLVESAHAWRNDRAAQEAYWLRRGLPARRPGEMRASLFAYENRAVGELLATWAAGTQPVCCLIPEGRVLTDVVAGFAHRPLAAGDRLQQGALTLAILPFSDQDDYDRLLWSCDLNFVRGEDSFVRAQLAGRPLVWHIYPQEDAAHWVKLDAFWHRCLQGVAPAPAAALRGLNHAWNNGQGIAEAWQRFAAEFAALDAHAQAWQQALVRHGDLAGNLLAFIARQHRASHGRRPAAGPDVP